MEPGWGSRMPEGDTLFRTAAALRPWLQDREVLAAQARVPGPGPAMSRVVGATVTAVEARGKHLIVSFSNGLALHTHLRMYGAWHRYAPGERWRKPAHRASAVLEVADSVAVCFNAPVVELLQARTMQQHPTFRTLGPDLLAPAFDAAEAMRRLRAPERAELMLSEALLDQRALAGVGNIFKSEILFVERLDPWLRLREIDDARLSHVLETAERLLRANAGDGPRTTTNGAVRARGARLWVYGREGRPCFRCGARIALQMQGTPARVTFWCRSCQGESAREHRNVGA